MKQPERRPNRRSIRLKGYNYGDPGAYYVTICSYDHSPVFGRIADNALVASQWGEFAEAWWSKIPERWHPVKLDQFVVMPNHVHGILLFPDEVSATTTLGNVVNWYKGSVTKSIMKLEGNRESQVWQRSFYEHIVRDDGDLLRIQEYITANPYKWADDEYNSAKT